MSDSSQRPCSGVLGVGVVVIHRDSREEDSSAVCKTIRVGKMIVQVEGAIYHDE